MFNLPYPDFAIARHSPEQLYILLLRYKEASIEFEQAMVLYGDSMAIPEITKVDALSGDNTKARIVLNSWLEESNREYNRPTEKALTYLALDDTNQTFAWPEEAFDQRSLALVGLKVDQRYYGLLGDPRFITLIKK
jgi:hypothetical protein